MYKCIKQDLIHLENWEYRAFKYLCHQTKNLYNQALYNVRQEYFETGKWLSSKKNYHLLKDSQNYKILNSHIADSTIRKLDALKKSFYELLKAKKEGKFKGKVRLPGYLPKKGYFQLVIPNPRVRNGKLLIPVSRTFRKNRPHFTRIEIQVPSNLDVDKLKEVRIIPRQGARFFTVIGNYLLL